MLVSLLREAEVLRVLGQPLAFKYGTDGFIPPAPRPPSTMAQFTPELSQGSSTTSIQRSMSPPSDQPERPRYSSVDDELYALAQLAKYLDGAIDLEAEAARREAEEARGIRQAWIDFCTERVRSGERSQKRMDGAMKRLGYA